MRVIHVVPSIDERASGPSYSVPRLCEGLIKAGVQVQLATLTGQRKPARQSYLNTFPRSLGPSRLGFSRTMARWLEAASESGGVDFIHNHSLWMMPNVYAGVACRKGRARLIASPRGTLSEWALSRNALQKKIFWRTMQEPALRRAVCLHATSEREYADIRRTGFRQPICILPNGIEVPEYERRVRTGRKRLLFLGRIHPIKGIDMLLRAWRIIEPRFDEWDLHIVGPDNDGFRLEMQALAGELSLKRVFFREALFDGDKLEAYRTSNIYVLPTHSENFGMTVAEALAAGTPAIVTKGAPWSGLEQRNAGWWIDIGVDSLVSCLESALALPEARLAEMGVAGRDWMIRDYSWDRLGEQLAMVYKWLKEGGTPPSSIHTT